jgi:hypothetical protein
MQPTNCGQWELKSNKIFINPKGSNQLNNEFEKQKFIIRAGVFVIISLFVLSAGIAHAQGGLVPCRGTRGDPCEMADMARLALNIINLLLELAGIVALAMLIWGGTQMLLSAGRPDKIAQGRSTLTNAIVGLSLTLAAYLIINTVVSIYSGGNLQGVFQFWQ